MIIYKVTCLETNKIYIGKTIERLSDRKSDHYSSAKREKHPSVFHKALMKYKKEYFVWEILDSVMFSDLLLELEKFYISKYNCKIPNGYNMTDGGEGNTGYVPTKETIEKIRLSKIGKRHTEETREKFRNRIFSKETRMKMSESRMGRVVTPETREKLRLAMMGREISEDARKKISASKTGKCGGEKHPMFGKQHREDSKNKMRASRIKYLNKIKMGAEE